MRDQARDKPLPTHAAPESSVQPEAAIAGPEDLLWTDRIGFRRHPRPVPPKRMQRILHDGHGVQLYKPRAGFFEGLQIASKVKAQMRLPESDVSTPADAPITNVGAPKVLDHIGVIRQKCFRWKMDLRLGRAERRFDLGEKVLYHCFLK